MTAPTLLRADDAWARAMALSVRAFVDEPFVVELFGEDRRAREQGVQSLFGDAEPWPGAVVIGIERDGALVASAVLTQPGSCHACSRADDPPPSAGSAAYSEWRFEQNVVEAHRPLGPHGWLAKVAVDPNERGGGLGRMVVQHARSLCRGPVVLECQPHRGDFYAACGFDVVGTVPDPAGPEALLMMARP